MLKLNSNNTGKFDIVFEANPLLENNAKLSGCRATSAGRRKNNEWKSRVFNNNVPKEPNYTKVKASKTTQLRQSNRLNQQKYAHIKEKQMTQTNDIKKPPPSRRSSNLSEHNKSGTKTRNVSRDNTFTKTNETPKETDGYISKEHLQELYNKLQNCENDKTVEPDKVPGLNLSPNSSGVGSPALLDTSREDDIRRKQATPEEPYNPWGKPGSGAPSNDRNGNIQTKRNIGQILKDQQKQSEKQLPNKQKTPEKKAGTKITPEVTPMKIDSSTPILKSSPFARGQPKSKEEFNEMEKKRLKHLQHQEAIAAQVEEKRRKKKEEQERKIREDQEAEEKFKREQEMLKMRLEEENRKQREKEEAKLMKQKMLEEEIEKAKQEALKAKQEARRNRNKTENTSLQRNAVSPEYTRTLHHDDEPIRPKQEQLYDLYDEEPIQLKQKHHPYDDEPIRPKQKTPRNRYEDYYMEESTQQKKKSPTEEPHGTHDKDSRQSRMVERMESLVDEYLVPNNRTETAVLGSDRPIQKNDKTEKTKNKKKKQQRTDDSEIHEKEHKSKQKENYRPEPRDIQDRPVHEIQKYRTGAGEMIERSAHNPSVSSSPKKVSRESGKQTFNLNIQPSSPDSPSTRQQKILEQLAALRQGLLQKEKECYQGTWTR